MDDIFEQIMGVFLATVSLGAVCLVVGFFVNIGFVRQAFSERTACLARQGIPHQKTLSTKVVCVPSLLRQDTTTIYIK